MAEAKPEETPGPYAPRKQRIAPGVEVFLIEDQNRWSPDRVEYDEVDDAWYETRIFNATFDKGFKAGVESANERNEAQWLEASRRLNVLYARSSAEGGLYLEEVQRIIDEERGKA